LNKAVITWAADREIFFTRSRPYKKNDQATIEYKNNHLVRKYGFYYRYDTDAERKALNRLWRLVNDRFNYLTPTKKPVGWGEDRHGRRRRLYDAPATPLARLLAAGVLSPASVEQGVPGFRVPPRRFSVQPERRQQVHDALPDLPLAGVGQGMPTLA
jgi:hypothetical protein